MAAGDLALVLGAPVCGSGGVALVKVYISYNGEPTFVHIMEKYIILPRDYADRKERHFRSISTDRWLTVVSDRSSDCWLTIVSDRSSDC